MAEPVIKARLELVSGGSIPGGGTSGGTGGGASRAMGNADRMQQQKANRATTRFLPLLTAYIIGGGLASGISGTVALAISGLAATLGLYNLAGDIGKAIGDKLKELDPEREDKKIIGEAAEDIGGGLEKVTTGLYDMSHAGNDFMKQTDATVTATSGLSKVFEGATKLTTLLTDKTGNLTSVFGFVGHVAGLLLKPFREVANEAHATAVAFKNARSMVYGYGTAGQDQRTARLLAQEEGIHQRDLIHVISWVSDPSANQNTDLVSYVNSKTGVT